LNLRRKAAVVAAQAILLGEVFIARENRRKTMEFLLSHWHCIVPAAAIVAVMLLRGRGKKKQGD
jgi:hypothetical protein